MAEARDLLRANIPDVRFNLLNGGLDKLTDMASSGAGFQIQLSSPNLSELRAASGEVQRLMARDPEVLKVELNVDFERRELVADLALDVMGRLGLSPYESALTARIVFSGLETGRYRSGTVDYDIVLTSDMKGKPITQSTLDSIVLYSAAGEPVHLGSVAVIRTAETASQIYRKNRLKTVTVTGFTKNRDFSKLRQRMTAVMADLAFPPTLKWQIGGASALLSESLRKLLVALGISLFLVYAVMVIQFQRFTQPLIIMASVPFCLVGVVLGLLAFGSQLSMIAFLAIIALGGIVVNNAIVMVDYMNLLRKDSAVPLLEAIIEGAGTRLKPVLMTTLTTMFGVLPMALSKGNGAEFYAPLGQAIFGGMVTSTAITLFIVPVLYHLAERRRARARVGVVEAAASELRR